MSLEADLVAVIGPLVAGRCYPDSAPFDTPRPYATYQQIGGAVINYTGNEAPGLRNALVQVNLFHDTRLAVNAMARQVEDALRAATAFQATPEGALIANHEPDLQRYGTLQAFSIWHPA